MMNRFLVSISLLACCAAQAAAQSSVSPYSLFGVGAADMDNHGESTAMAGLGIGLSLENELNSANPAALASLKPKTFVFDVAASGSVSIFSGHGKNAFTGTGNLDRAALGFRVADFMSLGFGLAPYSNVGYRIRESTFVDGADEKFTTYWSGSGGLHKIHLDLAFSPVRNLSVGISGSVIMGTITHEEYTESWTTQWKSSANVTPYIDFGVQYRKPFNRHSSIAAGITYGCRQKVTFKNTRTVTDNADTSSVTEKARPSTSQYIPESYGIGISYSSMNLVVGIDYTHKRWSALSSGSDVIRYKDMNRLTLGMSYTPDLYDVRRYWKKIRFMLGLSVDDSYLMSGSISGFNWTVTAGMSLPVGNATRLYWSLGFRQSSFPVSSRNTVSENQIQLTFGVSFGENWFMRKRYQ